MTKALVLGPIRYIIIIKDLDKIFKRIISKFVGDTKLYKKKENSS